jgi:hypothetical protein
MPVLQNEKPSAFFGLNENLKKNGSLPRVPSCIRGLNLRSYGPKKRKRTKRKISKK